jgi:aspartate-semialdehyde dehydrogenase
MIKYKPSSIFALAVLVMLYGCNTLPIDTLNKRIAVFEVSYEQVLVTIDRWIDEQRLVGAEKETVKEHVRNMYKTRLAMYVAIKSGDLSTAEGRLQTSMTTLELVRQVIIDNEARQNAATAVERGVP